MITVYKLISCQRKDTSAKKGVMKYILRDEDHQERTVVAIARIGLFRQLKSIHPIHHRETPLVEVLAKASVNDDISIDFTNFNTLTPRESSERKRKENSKVLKEMTNAKEYSPLSIIDFHRFLQLFLVAMGSLGAFLGIKSYFF